MFLTDSLVGVPARLDRLEWALPVVIGNVALAGLLGAGLAGPVLFALLAVVLARALVDRPQRGVVLLVALAPFHGLLLIVPHPVAVEAWKEVLALVCLGATFLAPTSARAPAGRRLPKWALPVAVVVGLAVATSVVVTPLQALQGLRIGYFWLVVAAVCWRCPLDRRERDRLVSVLMVVAFVTALVGLWQQVVGAERLAAIGWPYNDTIRFAGNILRSFSTFNQPFPFGFFLMTVLLVGLPIALDDPKRPRNQAFLAVTPVLVLGLGSTIVRGAWLGLIVGAFFLGVVRYRVLLLAFPLAFVGLLFLPLDVITPALSPSSTNERVVSWEENIARVAEAPLGGGIGTTGAASFVSLVDEPYQPDNYYFKILFELGVPGLWIFALVLVSAGTWSRRIADTLDGDDHAFALGVTALVLAGAAASTVATFFEIFPADLLFWVLLTIVATLRPEEQPVPVS